MHCVPFHNRPVSEVRALLADRGLDIQVPSAAHMQEGP